MYITIMSSWYYFLLKYRFFMKLFKTNNINTVRSAKYNLDTNYQVSLCRVVQIRF